MSVDKRKHRIEAALGRRIEGRGIFLNIARANETIDALLCVIEGKAAPVAKPQLKVEDLVRAVVPRKAKAGAVDHVAAYNNITNPVERGRYFAAHRAEITAVARALKISAGSSKTSTSRPS